MSYPKLYVLSTILMLVGTAPAYAYLDPGTGSMLLQGLIGGAVAAGSVISLYWGRLKALVTGTKPEKDNDKT